MLRSAADMLLCVKSNICVLRFHFGLSAERACSSRSDGEGDDGDEGEGNAMKSSSCSSLFLDPLPILIGYLWMRVRTEVRSLLWLITLIAPGIALVVHHLERVDGRIEEVADGSRLTIISRQCRILTFEAVGRYIERRKLN